MCIIIDTNCLAGVFNTQSADHEQFKPILDWIQKKNGKVVLGGKMYKQELAKTPYVKIIKQLQTAGKAIMLNDKNVDKYQKIIERIEHNPDFDDPHLIAMVRESKCKIICSLDARAYPFIKNSKFYESPSHKPKVYSSKRNSKLLCDKNIAEICKCS